MSLYESFSDSVPSVFGISNTVYGVSEFQNLQWTNGEPDYPPRIMLSSKTSNEHNAAGITSSLIPFSPSQSPYSTLPLRRSPIIKSQPDALSPDFNYAYAASTSLTPSPSPEPPRFDGKDEVTFLSGSLALPTTVPLRATQANDAMRRMMGVLRLNPFALNLGLGERDKVDKSLTWCGEVPGPLQDAPEVIMWQLNDYGEPSAEDLANDPSLQSFPTEFSLDFVPMKIPSSKSPSPELRNKPSIADRPRKVNRKFYHPYKQIQQQQPSPSTSYTDSTFTDYGDDTSLSNHLPKMESMEEEWSAYTKPIALPSVSFHSGSNGQYQGGHRGPISTLYSSYYTHTNRPSAPPLPLLYSAPLGDTGYPVVPKGPTFFPTPASMIYSGFRY